MAENKKDNDRERNIANLAHIKKDLDEFDNLRDKSYAKRVACLLGTFIGTWLLITMALIPLISFMFLSAKPAKVLNEKLGESTSPNPKDKSIVSLFTETDSIEEILTKDALFTAWDIQNRSPRQFSKWAF